MGFHRIVYAGRKSAMETVLSPPAPAMATDFVVKWELGRGAFGIVYLIEKKDTKEKLALKAVDLRRSQASEMEEDENEVDLVRRLDNPYVVSYVTSYVLGDLLCIITEFCEGGNLGSYLEKNSPLPEDLIVCWTAQITMALEYLHKEKVLHRGLKPPNIYLTGNCNIRVGDLSSARVLKSPDATATTIAGTPLYMSPEISKRRPYNFKADIWSLGCVVFEMAAGHQALKERFRSGKVPSLPSRYSVPLRSLVTKMVDKEPQNRPDASSLLTTSPIKDYLVTPRPPMEIMKTTRTALRDGDIKVPLDALQIHRGRMERLGENVTKRGDRVPRRVDAAAPKGSNALNVLLVGKTGVGKSATGNSILGREAFKVGAGSSVTKACEGADGERFNESIFVVDTPGACDTEELDTLKIIDNYVTEFLCELHVICLVLSAAIQPTQEEMNTVKRVCSLLEPTKQAHLIVVVTREEDLRREGKTARDFLLTYTGAGAELLKGCVEDDRVVGLDNFKGDTKEKQVQTFFQKTKEILAKNKGSLYTPAVFMQRMAELEKEQEATRRMQQRLKEEKEELERQKRDAEIEEAARKIRQEEEEKAYIEKMEEIKALQQRHEEERRIQEEESDRRRKEFEEKQRRYAKEIEDEQKRQQKKWVEQQAEIKHRDAELEKKLVEAQKAERKRQEEDTRRRNEDERLRALQDQIQKDKEATQKKEERIRKQGEDLRRKEEEWERKRRQVGEDLRHISPVTHEGGDAVPGWKDGAATKGPQTLNIILVGKTGVGKSATGNSILGQEDAFAEDSGPSVIGACQGRHGKRFNEDVYVIDTPGICDTDNVDSLAIIDNFISKNQCELHAICLVISASNRPTRGEVNAIASLRSLLGPAMLAYLIVVVTREFDLRRKEKTARDFLLPYIRAGAEILNDCLEDDRVVGLDNYSEEWREKQIQTLLQKTKELVAKHQGVLYTTSLFLENKKELEKEREKITREKQEFEEEKERLEKEALEAEKEAAARQARLEVQEKAAREREEEMQALQRRYEEEKRQQQEEADRLMKEFEEEERKLAEAREADEKR